MHALIDKLKETKSLSKAEWIQVIEGRTPEMSEYVFTLARNIRHTHYGKEIYIRGLIEFTNYCKNDCHYCGIQASNKQVVRYRLSKEEILACCKTGWELGFRTFVLQGGEDNYYTDDRMVDIINAIKLHYPDCAITLSLGERSRQSYQRLFDAGADRYLLRHETASSAHYSMLHPANLTAEARQKCLYDLKEIGYEVGTGFMVGTPGQTAENLAEDLLFIEKLDPHMVGIGPFIPHQNTVFRNQPAGCLDLTLYMLGLLRLLSPKLLLPATTALGTINPKGRERGILAGANVIMPNLSPTSVRKNYALYDNKICTGDEAAECRQCSERRMRSIGYHTVVARGNSLV